MQSVTSEFKRKLFESRHLFLELFFFLVECYHIAFAWMVPLDPFVTSRYYYNYYKATWLEWTQESSRVKEAAYKFEETPIKP